MLRLVTGPPGSGKTWYVVREIYADLMAGRYVATNVKLVDGWQEAFARQNYWVRFTKGKKGVERLAEKYDEHFFSSGDLDELFALRLPPCRRCKACRKDRPCQKEGRGRMHLDEAHEWLNARTWNTDETGKKLDQGVSILKRLKVVKFFALHRKLGWHINLVTQSEKRLDNQVRDNFEYHTHLKNMRRFKIWGLIPCVPFNLFVAITNWHASGGERVGIKTYLLNKLAETYDTMARTELYESGFEDGVILLPLSPEDRAARRAATWRSPVAQPERVDVNGRSAAEGRFAPPARAPAAAAVRRASASTSKLPVNPKDPAGAGSSEGDLPWVV